MPAPDVVFVLSRRYLPLLSPLWEQEDVDELESLDQFLSHAEAIRETTPPATRESAAGEADRVQSDQDFCENCHETVQLAKIKGCIRCLKCGFKADCSGV